MLSRNYDGQLLSFVLLLVTIAHDLLQARERKRDTIRTERGAPIIEANTAQVVWMW